MKCPECGIELNKEPRRNLWLPRLTNEWRVPLLPPLSMRVRSILEDPPDAVCFHYDRYEPTGSRITRFLKNTSIPIGEEFEYEYKDSR